METIASVVTVGDFSARHALPRSGEKLSLTLGPYSRAKVAEFAGFTKDWNSLHRDPETVMAWCAAFRKGPAPEGQVIVPGQLILTELNGILLSKFGDKSSPIEILLRHREPIFTGEKIALDARFLRVSPGSIAYVASLEGDFIVERAGRNLTVGWAKTTVVKLL